jgi:hypothetical protein
MPQALKNIPDFENKTGDHPVHLLRIYLRSASGT